MLAAHQQGPLVLAARSPSFAGPLSTDRASRVETLREQPRALPWCAAGAVVSVVAAQARPSRGLRTSRKSKMARRQAVQAVETKPKKSLAATLPDCPRTIWNADEIDLKKMPKVSKTGPLVIDAKEMDLTSEYFAAE
eukprot:1824566-Amphidinium_carterae.1